MVYQRSVANRFNERARQYLGLNDEVPKVIFEGFNTGWSDDEIIRSWEWLNDYHVLPFPGAYLDQPMEWRNDMDMCTAMYNGRKAVLAIEKAKRGNS